MSQDMPPQEENIHEKEYGYYVRTQEEEIIYRVRTLDAEGLENALWKIVPGTLELKNIETNHKTPCNLSNINAGMKLEKLAHGWWVDNGCFGNLRGYKIHPKIHSIGSLLHVLISLYYEVRLSVFNVPLLESYKKVFKVLLDHGADPNKPLHHPFMDSNQFEKIYVDLTGQTPLHFAVAQFDIEGVKILLDNGADPTLEHSGCKSVVQMVQDLKDNHGKEIHPYSSYHTDSESYKHDTNIMYNLVMEFKKDITV